MFTKTETSKVVHQPDSVDEEIVDGISVSLRYSGFLGCRSTPDDVPLKLVRLEEVRHFTRVEDVVDVLQKLFHHDLHPPSHTRGRTNQLHTEYGRTKDQDPTDCFSN